MEALLNTARALVLAIFATAAMTGAGQAAANSQDPLSLLPARVAGVTGSGDQMVLHLGDGDTERLIRQGEDYDGWRLIRLTPTVAQFSKSATTRTIGLNPQGILTSPVVAPGGAQVFVAGGLTDLLRRVTGAGRKGFGPLELLLGVGPTAPTMKLDDLTSDGWRLASLNGFEAIFERGGIYQSVGLRDGPVMGAPGEIFGLQAIVPIAFSAANFPADLFQRSPEDRMTLYRTAITRMQAELAATGAPGFNPLHIEQVFGTAAYADWDTLGRRVGVLTATAPTARAGAPPAVRLSIDPASGAIVATPITPSPAR